jgi:hypothetical protein
MKGPGFRHTLRLTRRGATRSERCLNAHGRPKGYLDANQLKREQMCLAILTIDRRFTDLRPRHPRAALTAAVSSRRDFATSACPMGLFAASQCAKIAPLCTERQSKRLDQPLNTLLNPCLIRSSEA